MIFVSIGTQDKPFLRLIKAIDELKRFGDIDDQIIVQNDTLAKCDLFITHGGVGNIMTALKMNKKIIAVPRLGDLGEHENNHQTQIVSTFSDNGHVLACNDPLKDLKKVIIESKTFQPKAWISQKETLIQDLKREIGL